MMAAGIVDCSRRPSIRRWAVRAIMFACICSVPLPGECNTQVNASIVGSSKLSFQRRTAAEKLEMVAASAGWSLKPLVDDVANAATIQPLTGSRIAHTQELNSPRSHTFGSRSTRALLQADTGALVGLGEGTGTPEDEDTSDVCMGLSGNVSVVDIESESAPADPCTFRPGEETWESSCSNAYFGGSPNCCFSTQLNGTCSLCKTLGQCEPSAAVRCASR